MIKPEQIPDEVVEELHDIFADDFGTLIPKGSCRAAINAMRPFIRAEALEEAATAIQNLWRIEDCYGAAAAIRALKEKP